MDTSKLAQSMKILYEEIRLSKKIIDLERRKNDLLTKKELIADYCKIFRYMNKGKLSIKLLEDLSEIKSDFQSLYDNFDDRLMIFILGAGNVGKSTLLNSLVGYEVAKTGILPVTWKIDVYSPDTDLENVKIKYKDGTSKKIHIEKAKGIISKEESKTKTSKKNFNYYFQKELISLVNPEEIKETEKYLSEKYLYNSLIREVWWPVKNNWILEKCILVDTPGLNQYVNNNMQIGNINDYYHKADGILWLVDGLTIAAASPSEALHDLNSNLIKVGGLRNNIIGVVNGIDKIRNNGGDEAVLKVINNAKDLYNEMFSKTLGISAKLAYEGIRDNNTAIIEESGISNLQTTIRELFITKAEELKHGAKEQGKNKLLKILDEKLKNYISDISHYDMKHKKICEKLDKLSDDLKRHLESAFDDYYQNYINQVTQRVDVNINALGEGKESDFILEEIYQIPTFKTEELQFFKEALNQISISTDNWRRFSAISEYKYIRPHNTSLVNYDDRRDLFNFSNLYTLKYFSLIEEEGLLNFLDNLFGKAMFFFRKKKMKEQLIATIQSNVNNLREARISDLNNIINHHKAECLTILNSSFEELIFKHANVNKVTLNTQSLIKNINISHDETNLYDLLTTEISK